MTPVQQLQSALEFSAAIGRIRRESLNNQSEPPHSPGLVSVLESRQLENLQRLPLTGQVKITPHICVHRSSTPAGSQNPTPSASFRQISVIQSVDSVFEEDSSLAQEVAENSLQPIAHSLPSSQISIMEEKENEIQTLKDEMDATRRCLPVGGINHVNVDRLADVPEDLREKLMNRELKILKSFMLLPDPPPGFFRDI